MTAAIMLTLDLVSQIVLWKEYPLIVHSMLGTHGSSFLIRKGDLSRRS